MAETIENIGSAQPDLNALAKDHVDQIYDVKNLQRLERVITNSVQAGLSNAVGGVMSSLPAIGRTFGKVAEEGERDLALVMAPILAKLVGLILGVEVPANAIHNSGDPEHSIIGDAVGAVAMKAVGGHATGELEPSDEPAKQYIGVLAHIITHCWAEGIILEKIEGYTSWSGHIEAIAQLGKDLVDGMGLSRLARVALHPLAQIALATPLQWKAHKQFRPTLLTASTIARQWARGRWDWADVTEELARQGYNDARIAALINEQRKFISVAEASVLARHVGETNFDAVGYLGEAGWETADATQALLVEETKRIEAQETAMATVAIDAYVRRDIEQPEFESIISSVVTPAAEQRRFQQLGALKREVARKFMTAGQAEACVKAGVLPMAAYREVLAREGYGETDALALELLLEKTINDKADVEKLKRQKADAAAVAKQAKDDAAAAHKAQIEQERAIAKLGPVSELVRAVVRGLIPIDRLVTVLSAHYDPSTVQIFVHDAELQRQSYLEAQAKADAIKKRAAVRHIDTAQLEQAVLDGVLTISQFRAGLEGLNFAPADVDVLAGTLAARVADRKASTEKRALADAVAKTRGVTLPAFEALVRAGHRTVAEYDSLLHSLGVDDAARADILDLLNVHIAADQKAAATRAAIANADRAKGLSLAETRRAVILGVQSIEWFQAWLVANKYTVDTQTVLVAELQDDVAAAEAARKKRLTTKTPSGAGRLSLATAAKAARLGVITPAAYRARLVDAGYSADDMALDLDLLVHEIAAMQAKRARANDVTLATLAKAVKLSAAAGAPSAGAVTIDDYRAKAIALGYDQAAVDDLVSVLQDELAVQADAAARRVTIDGELATKTLTLRQLEAAVTAGDLSLEKFSAQLDAYGYGAADVQLLTALLAAKLPIPAPPGGN